MAWNFNENDDKDFGPKMEPGPRQAVVFAVYDMGLQETIFKGTTKVQHKIRLGIELNELYTDGKFKGQRVTKYPKFTLSFYENANLAAAVRGILGRDMTEQEIKEGGDVLIGKNFQLTVTYGTKDGVESKYPDFMYSPLMKGIEWIKPVLTPDYLPDFITKERQEKTVKRNEETPNKEENYNNDFADADAIERERMIQEIKTYRDAGKVSDSALKATRMLVMKRDEQISKATLEEVREIYRRTIPADML